MSDGESAMQEVVDATAPIADAAVREVWPYKKVLLAVLPPTLALFSVLVGVWDNGNRDRNARAEAEAVRAEAALEAERTRADEVDKARRAAEEREETRKYEAERERKLREAELALPRYEELLTAVHATMREVADCQRHLNPYLASTFRLAVELDGTPKTFDRQELMTPLVPAPAELQEFPVDRDVVDSCSKIGPTLDQLTLSLDIAMLVTGPQDLVDAATGLAETLEDLSDQAEDLLARIDPETYTISATGDGDFRFADGVAAAYLLWNLDLELGEVEPASKLLIEAARGVVLELEP